MIRRLAVGGMWLAALGLLVSASQPWWRIAGTTMTGDATTSGGAQGLALAALAGTLLAAWLRSWGRKVASAAVAVVHVGAGWLAAVAVHPVEPPLGVPDDAAWTVEPFRWVYLGLALIGAVSSALAIVTRPPVRPASGAEDEARSDPPLDAWKALDAGVDPSQEWRGDTQRRPGPE